MSDGGRKSDHAWACRVTAEDAVTGWAGCDGCDGALACWPYSHSLCDATSRTMTAALADTSSGMTCDQTKDVQLDILRYSLDCGLQASNQASSNQAAASKQVVCVCRCAQHTTHLARLIDHKQQARKGQEPGSRSSPDVLQDSQMSARMAVPLQPKCMPFVRKIVQQATPTTVVCFMAT